MDIPPAWAWALTAAGASGALAAIGLCWPTSPVARLIPPATHLLAGGLIGFMALAVYPALPLMAAIGGMMTVRAIEASRWIDASLLAIGFGIAWTAIIGYRIVQDAVDAAVSSNWDLTPWLVAGVLVLLAGLVGLAWSILLSERFSRR